MADPIGSSGLEEVEVESMPIVDIAEGPQVGTVEELIEGQQMVSFHSLPDQIQEEIVLQPQEEIVGEEPSGLVSDEGLVYIDNIPVPAPHNIDLSVSRSIKNKKSPKKQTLGSRSQVVVTSPSDQLYNTGASSSDKKWEQKKFQIQTSDGEFSVTMWASGRYCDVLFHGKQNSIKDNLIRDYNNINNNNVTVMIINK